MSTVYRRRKGESSIDSPHADETPVLSRDLFGPDIEKCFACGELEASGHWHGVGAQISVCSRCAVAILPKLAADAIAGEFADAPGVMPQLAAATVKMKAAFWEAAAATISRATKLTRAEASR